MATVGLMTLPTEIKARIVFYVLDNGGRDPRAQLSNHSSLGPGSEQSDLKHVRADEKHLLAILHTCSTFYYGDPIITSSIQLSLGGTDQMIHKRLSQLPPCLSHGLRYLHLDLGAAFYTWIEDNRTKVLATHTVDQSSNETVKSKGTPFLGLRLRDVTFAMLPSCLAHGAGYLLVLSSAFCAWIENRRTEQHLLHTDGQSVAETWRPTTAPFSGLRLHTITLYQDYSKWHLTPVPVVHWPRPPSSNTFARPFGDTTLCYKPSATNADAMARYGIWAFTSQSMHNDLISWQAIVKSYGVGCGAMKSCVLRWSFRSEEFDQIFTGPDNDSAMGQLMDYAKNEFDTYVEIEGWADRQLECIYLKMETESL